MPEFLERRFNPASRWVLSVISLVAYVVTKIAVGIFAGGIVFSVLLPEMRIGPLDSFWIGSILVILLTGAYTVLGGLRAVAYTEALQTLVLVLGSLLVTFFGLKALGGWSELRTICGSEMFNLWKPLVPDGVTATWAPVKEAGRMAWYFNASATLFTMDFYSRLHPGVSQHRLVWIGRVATAIMVLIGLAWIPVIQGGRGLYDYLQGVQAYLAPPIFVVFFLGIFWIRLNGPGCLAALIVGFIMGLARLAIDTPVKLIDGFAYAEGSFLWIINNMFFQYYSMLILAVCMIVMVMVSYVTRQPDYSQITGLTFGTITAEQREASRQSWSAIDVIASGVVLAAILAAYLYFRG